MWYGGRREEKGREKRERKCERLQGMGTMCKVVDDSCVFDAEMGRVLSDSGIVGVM